MLPSSSPGAVIFPTIVAQYPGKLAGSVERMRLLDIFYVEGIPGILSRITAMPRAFDASGLHDAARVGNLEIVEILLSHGYGRFLNSFDEWSFTPLMWAAALSHTKTTYYLLKYGADINIFDEEKAGNTVLNEVVKTGKCEIIELLCSKGADPTIRGWMNLNSVDSAEQRYIENPNDENRKILELIRKCAEKRTLKKRR